MTEEEDLAAQEEEMAMAQLRGVELAKRLRKYAIEYAKISSRASGIQAMVEDMRAAADLFDPPA